MRIFGIRLSKTLRYVHVDDAEEFPDAIPLDPETQYSSACHLYEDSNGIQYVGYELSLGMPEEEMSKTLKGKGKKYTLR